MNLDPFGKLLSFGKVSDAEAEPGLYAWYLRIRPGDRNIESAENFLRSLKRTTEELQYPTMPMQARGHFRLKMQGDLKHIWYGHEENKFTDQLQEVLSNSEERELLGNILEYAVPLLTGPLYIGVSKNLQTRLQQHVKLIQEYQEGINQFSSSDIAESLENDKNFAQRIVERKINPNRLVVCLTYVPYPHFPSERIRKTIETAETLLNKMFYPILGRR